MTRFRALSCFVCAALALAGVPAAAISVLQPTFTATTLPAVSGYAVNSLRLADMDGDGIADLISTENSGSLVIRYLDASGGVSRIFRIAGLGQPPKSTGLGDFNHDGRLDIVVVHAGNNQTIGGLYLLLQKPDGTFGNQFGSFFQAPPPFVTFSGGQEAIIGDVNEDGDPDLIVPANSGGVRLFLGNGSGFSSTPTIVHASTFNDAYARLADVDGDGHLDLIVNNVTDPSLSPYSAGIHVLPGAGDGTFGAPALLSARLMNQALATGDLNGDGLDDIVAAGASFFAGNQHVAVFLAQPGGGFAAPVRLGGPSNTNISRVVLADLNGDATLDIASTPGSGSIQTFLNDGSGSFTSGPTLAGSAYSLAAGVVRPDADADVFAGTFSGTILAFRNDTAPGDTTPPVVTVPDPIVAEAEGPGGTHVSFTATAVDEVDGTSWAACAPASGSLFPVGTTSVSCSATDVAGNEGRAAFEVTIVDTTAPALSLPDDITTEATGAGGAIVSFAAGATDLVDGPLPVTCAPASGSTFPIGQTTVTCSAADSRGNNVTGSFTVHVRGPGDLLDDLWAVVQGTGPGNSLPAKVGAARAAYAAGDVASTCAMLVAFANEVRAQSGKHVPEVMAADLMARAAQIRQMLGC